MCFLTSHRCKNIHARVEPSHLVLFCCVINPHTHVMPSHLILFPSNPRLVCPLKRTTICPAEERVTIIYLAHISRNLCRAPSPLWIFNSFTVLISPSFYAHLMNETRTSSFLSLFLRRLACLQDNSCTYINL